jgi:cation transport regulator ChaB
MGMPSNEEDLPSTLKRSPEKVRDTYEKALDSAEEQYEGNEERAHRTAWAAVKHVAEKRGDHWEEKDEYGPSDERSARGGRFAREGRGQTAGGVDAGKTKDELMDDARAADIAGRSTMTKDELVDALRRHNDRATAEARGD